VPAAKGCLVQRLDQILGFQCRVLRDLLSAQLFHLLFHILILSGKNLRFPALENRRLYYFGVFSQGSAF